MNKAEMSTTKWSVTSPQQAVSRVIKAVHKPVDTESPGESASVKDVSSSSCTIDIRRMAEDAVMIRERKANARKTDELSGTRTIEPTGIFNKRARGR